MLEDEDDEEAAAASVDDMGNGGRQRKIQWYLQRKGAESQIGHKEKSQNSKKLKDEPVHVVVNPHPCPGRSRCLFMNGDIQNMYGNFTCLGTNTCARQG